MSLLSYQEARPWAKAIRAAVTERKMPPWSRERSEIGRKWQDFEFFVPALFIGKPLPLKDLLRFTSTTLIKPLPLEGQIASVWDRIRADLAKKWQ